MANHLEFNPDCEECVKVKEFFTKPDAGTEKYKKGAKWVEEEILFICHECLGKQQLEWSEKCFPKVHERLAKCKAEGRVFKNNIPLPVGDKEKKKK